MKPKFKLKEINDTESDNTLNKNDEIYLEKGSAFGEIALILDSKRTATI